MARFHVNNAGDTGTCKAGKDNCPFGGPDEHYSTREEAEAVAEKKLEKQYGLVNSVYKSGAGDTSRLDSMSTDMKKRIVMDSASGKNRIHPSVAAKVFSKDKDELVRRRVAENVKSQNMLRKMSSDESPKVREAVARSTNNPNVLRELAKDDDPKVRNAALKNERIPKRDKKKTIEAIKKAAVAKRQESASKKADTSSSTDGSLKNDSLYNAPDKLTGKRTLNQKGLDTFRKSKTPAHMRDGFDESQPPVHGIPGDYSIQEDNNGRVRLTYYGDQNDSSYTTSKYFSSKEEARKSAQDEHEGVMATQKPYDEERSARIAKSHEAYARYRSNLPSGSYTGD